MVGPEDWSETARRVRAAMAYGKLKRSQAAAIMGTEPGTLDRITGMKGSETRLATWEQLWQLADRVGLPREWFSADLKRLDEIVTEGPTFRRHLDPATQADLDEAVTLADGAVPGPVKKPREHRAN